MGARFLARRGAFTLLEVMLAVAILAMVGLSIYEFVELNMRAVLASSEQVKQEAAFRGLAALMQAQLNGIQPSQRNAVFGKSLTLHDASSDEVTWFAQAGNGVLTKEASGNYFVTFALRPSEKSDNTFELRMYRIQAADANNMAKEAALGSSKAQSASDWVLLLDDVAEFQVRFFSTNKDWDQGTNWGLDTPPKLIRVRIRKKIDDDPFEVVLNLPLK